VQLSSVKCVFYTDTISERKEKLKEEKSINSIAIYIHIIDIYTQISKLTELFQKTKG